MLQFNSIRLILNNQILNVCIIMYTMRPLPGLVLVLYYITQMCVSYCSLSHFTLILMIKIHVFFLNHIILILIHHTLSIPTTCTTIPITTMPTTTLLCYSRQKSAEASHSYAGAL